jgi:hypothetical protein
LKKKNPSAEGRSQYGVAQNKQTSEECKGRRDGGEAQTAAMLQSQLHTAQDSGRASKVHIVFRSTVSNRRVLARRHGKGVARGIA